MASRQTPKTAQNESVKLSKIQKLEATVKSSSVTQLSAIDCNISLLTNNRYESTHKTHDFETRNIPY